MSLVPDSAPPPPARVSALYKVGLVLVLLFDGALAVPFAYFRANRPTNTTLADVIGETVGYAGCSLACPLIVILGITIMIARASNRPLGPTVVKTLFWCGLTLVPLFLAFMALSYFATRH